MALILSPRATFACFVCTDKIEPTNGQTHLSSLMFGRLAIVTGLEHQCGAKTLEKVLQGVPSTKYGLTRFLSTRGRVLSFPGNAVVSDVPSQTSRRAAILPVGQAALCLKEGGFRVSGSDETGIVAGCLTSLAT